ncbi:RnfABCDGE type electron transport complex subunit D [Candidatus Poribacteria bacterium]|nr:RnfABCDGE type electron transport complex subunit D [Candidatus Poribacteria bacterium]
MKIIRKILDTGRNILEGRSGWGLFKPAWEALDKFYFGVPEITSGAPHVRDNISLKRCMIFVMIAAAPSALASVYFFGWQALLVIFVSYLFGVSTEWFFSAVRKEEINEGAFVTCLLYPLTLPPSIPLWVVAVGIVFGTVFGKEVFGGTGKNPFNPALTGRIFIAIAFPSIMANQWQEPIEGIFGGFQSYSPDGITSATPLVNFKGSGEITSYWHLLMGGAPGCLGETSRILIIIGGIFLMVTKISNWRIPLTYLGSVALLSSILSFFKPDIFAPPLFQLLAGGLMFGAMFMATDPVTCTMTIRGKWVYGIMLGILTVTIRGLSVYSEGVMFSILLMNIFAPLIDKSVLHRMKLRYET